MALLGKQIRLRGLSQKGKNRVRDHGDRWFVLAETDRVLFSPNTLGPWLFVSPNLPIGPGQDNKAARWIHAEQDPDFALVE